MHRYKSIGEAAALVYAHNMAPYIGDMLQRLTKMKHPQSELLIVDDASLDGSSKLIGEKFKTLADRVVLNDRILGLIMSVQNAARITRCRHLLIVQDKDVLQEGEAARLLEPLLTGEADMTLGVPLKNMRPWRRRFIDALLSFFSGTRVIGVSSLHIAIKREVILEIEKSGSPFAAGAELAARLLRKKRRLKAVEINAARHYAKSGFYESLMEFYAIVRHYYFD